MTMRSKTTLLAVAGLLAAGAVMTAVARPRQDAKPEDVIIIGRVVDLHTYMSGQYASDDPAKETRDNLRTGVPAGLEIEDGVIVIGMGKQNPARKLLALAYRDVELTGKLYDKDGLLYVDMQEVRPVEAEGAAEGEVPVEQPAPPPQPDGDQE